MSEEVVKDVEKKDRTDKHGNKNKKHKIIAIIILVVVALMLLNRCSNEKVSSRSRIAEGDIEATSRRSKEQLEQAAEDGMFMTFLNKNIAVDKNNTANILVKNDKSNKYNATVEYWLDDELIYETDTILPGYKQEEAILDYDLAPGVHKAKAVFCIIDENGKNLNRVTIPVTITK